MAIWQFSFWAIPDVSVMKVYSGIPSEISEEYFNSIDWFREYSGDYLAEINYLKPSEHWNAKVKFFGEYESDCIAIYYREPEQLNLCELYFRIDLSKNYRYMAEKMLNTVICSQLIMFDENLRLIHGDLEAILSSIEIHWREPQKIP